MEILQQIILFNNFKMGSVIKNRCCSDQNQSITKKKKYKNNPEQVLKTNIFSSQEKGLKKNSNQKNIYQSLTCSKVLERSYQIPQKRAQEYYQAMKIISEGTYGKSLIVKDKKTKKPYVLREIKKECIRQSMVLLSPLLKKLTFRHFFIGISQIFAQKQNVCLIMQLLPTEDLLTYISRKKIKVDQEILKNILTEVIIGLSILHSHNLIYGQLRPENIILGQNGHIKLDLYWNSNLMNSNDNSSMAYIGVQQYMAPEVCSGKYDTKIDMWGLGVLIYQLMFSKVPIPVIPVVQNNPQKLDYKAMERIKDKFSKANMKQILKGVKKTISRELFSLLSGLLQKNVQQRLDLRSVMDSQFFIGVDWQSIKNIKSLPIFNMKQDEKQHLICPTQRIKRKSRNVIFIGQASNNHQNTQIKQK